MNNKNNILVAVLTLVLMSCGNSEATKTASFTVYGNCGMCKQTIETSLDGVDGVSTAEWDMNSDKMTVSYDPKVIKLEKIHAKIAAVGYDTDLKRAPDAAYDKLHSCCKYDRPE